MSGDNLAKSYDSAPSEQPVKLEKSLSEIANHINPSFVDSIDAYVSVVKTDWAGRRLFNPTPGTSPFNLYPVNCSILHAIEKYAIALSISTPAGTKEFELGRPLLEARFTVEYGGFEEQDGSVDKKVESFSLRPIAENHKHIVNSQLLAQYKLLQKMTGVDPQFILIREGVVFTPLDLAALQPEIEQKEKELRFSSNPDRTERVYFDWL